MGQFEWFFSDVIYGGFICMTVSKMHAFIELKDWILWFQEGIIVTLKISAWAFEFNLTLKIFILFFNWAGKNIQQKNRTKLFSFYNRITSAREFLWSYPFFA
jgi:hypothetical protein